MADPGAGPSLIPGDAVILAGGRSSRMGTDKALLEVGGSTLLERLLGGLRRLFARVHVSIDPARPYEATGASLIPDRAPGRGPLEGVAASLAALRSPAFFAAVDLPVLSPPLIRALWAAAAEPGRRGAVPRWEGGLEPAFAVYGPDLLEDLERFLSEGRRDLRRLASLPGVEVLDLSDGGVRRRVFHGSAPLMADLFTNLNTREDLRSFSGGKS